MQSKENDYIDELNATKLANSAKGIDETLVAIDGSINQIYKSLVKITKQLEIANRLKVLELNKGLNDLFDKSIWLDKLQQSMLDVGLIDEDSWTEIEENESW